MYERRCYCCDQIKITSTAVRATYLTLESTPRPTRFCTGLIVFALHCSHKLSNHQNTPKTSVTNRYSPPKVASIGRHMGRPPQAEALLRLQLSAGRNKPPQTLTLPHKVAQPSARETNPSRLLTSLIPRRPFLLFAAGLVPPVQSRRRPGKPLLRLLQCRIVDHVRPVGFLGFVARDLLERGLEIRHAAKYGLGFGGGGWLVSTPRQWSWAGGVAVRHLRATGQANTEHLRCETRCHFWCIS